MKRKEKAKAKPYRSALDNSIWSFRGILRDAPLLFGLMILEVPLHVFLSYAGIWLPALVVAEVTNEKGMSHAFLAVGALILLMLAADILSSLCGQMAEGCLSRYQFLRGWEVDAKSLGLFYQTYEKTEIRSLRERAVRATQTWNGVQPISDVPRRSMKLVENILCYVLFGSVVSFVHPLLVLFLTLAPAVNWFCARAYRRWEYSHRGQWTDLDRRIWYVQGVTSDFQAAKDIRIYGMAGWFKEVYADLEAQRLGWEKQMLVRQFLSRVADLVVILLRDGLAYVLLIRMILEGSITVDRFLLYFSAISMFATFIGNIMDEWNGIRATSLDVCDYRRYMDLPEQDGTGEADVESLLGTAPEVVFDHVSFCYDGAKENTLDDIVLTIKPGEKVALVGENGAGKTTLVKLLCGLYLPTKGEIRIGGIPFGKFHRREYYRLFSAVFQDVQTGFFSLAETVSGQGAAETDEARAVECIRRAGLSEKLDALPQGIHTRLDKQLHRDGTDLSGGEAQKLMLARALYKDAPILVLDEPTAALDPIAENQIYLQYRDMTRDKTVLFISHRLASTRFCDRILYLKDGKVAEEGTHEELMALGGEYAGMYEMQSCWYKV